MSDQRQAELNDRVRDSEVARARRKVAALKSLYVHGSIFFVAIIGLFLIDWLSGANWWVQWVLFGWGIGVASHAIAVYFDISNRVARWEEHKVRELLRQAERNPSHGMGNPSRTA